LTQHRKRNKNLGLAELVAIALGGMVGGGIFTILGISVSMIGNLTPIAIIIGGWIASLAAYSYVKLGLYYRDEGATYSFYKRTYPKSHFKASAIGWFIVFGYISTLALYAYTFSSYAISSTDFAENIWIRKAVAIGVIGIFTLINIWSVNGMGKIEDLMVYTKLIVLTIISVVLMKHGTTDFGVFIDNMALDAENSSILSILIVASLTFVAYEGFQLVIHAMDEMNNPEKKYTKSSLFGHYFSSFNLCDHFIRCIVCNPSEDLIKNKEYALASGAGNILGSLGTNLVILGAILATSSAISGTIFGASRLMSVIATDGYFPNWLAIRKNNSPQNSIIGMAVMASILILIGGLELILEFGSITFLLVSLLMAIANYKIREKTNSSKFITALSIVGLGVGGILILYYEFTNKWEQMIAIVILYIILAFGAWRYSNKQENEKRA
jgi:amino acid transporter